MWNVKSKLRHLTLAALERRGGEKGMRIRLYVAVPLPVLLLAGVASAQYGGQYPLLDAAANKVIEKYQNSTCDQLWQDRYKPKTQREQEAIDFLHQNPQMRQMFIDRVAAPVANKLFKCGMIP